MSTRPPRPDLPGRSSRAHPHSLPHLRLHLPAELSPRRALAGAGRRVRTPGGTLLLSLAALLSVGILMVSSVGWAAISYFNTSVTRVSAKVGGKRPPERPGDMNVLLVGDDSREGTNGEYGTQAEVGGLHSDTTILAHLGANGTVTLMSIPRDTLVAVPPGVPNTPGDGRDKLTNVLANGGIGATEQVVEQMTGLKINHFIIIDLEGFKKMTNAVGNVTVCVSPLPNGSTMNLNDNFSQWHGHLGENSLNGDQALSFVRTRHALGDERLRIQRQQVFLSALLTKATSSGVLANPIKLTSLLGAIGSTIKVDDTLTQSGLLSLAQRLRGVAGGARFITLPTHVALPADGAVDGEGNIPPHGDVLIFDQAKAEPILAPLRPVKPGTSATPGGTPVAPAVPPAQVTVTSVRNDTGRAGLAGSAATTLRKLGFGGALSATTGVAGLALTEVRYAPGSEAAARTLVAAVPGSQAVADPTATSGLVLVLGSTFTGVKGAATGGATAGGSGGAPGGTAVTPTPAPVTTAPPAPNCTP